MDHLFPSFQWQNWSHNTAFKTDMPSCYIMDHQRTGLLKDDGFPLITPDWMTF